MLNGQKSWGSLAWKETFWALQVRPSPPPGGGKYVLKFSVAPAQAWLERVLDLKESRSTIKVLVVNWDASTSFSAELHKVVYNWKKNCRNKNKLPCWLCEEAAECHPYLWEGGLQDFSNVLSSYKEQLVTEKESDLQKWRAERDQLVAALEVQLSSLVSSNRQKDQAIEELKTALNTCGKVSVVYFIAVLCRWFVCHP